MGRARPAEGQPPQTATEKEVAALVVAILAGAYATPNPTLAIAEALLNLLPAFLPSPVKVRISADVARMVSEVGTEPRSDSGAILAAHRSNLAYRALFAVQAVKRLVKAVRGPGEESVDERLTRAFSAERSYLEAHLNASKRRERQAEVLRAMADAYGPILSWNHRDIGKTHRKSHLRAANKNFDVREVPKSTGSLPGMEPGCHCHASPPRPGARKLS